MTFNALGGCAIAAGVLYSVLIDGTFFCCWLAILIPYLVVTQVVLKDHAANGKRRSTAIATWGHPTDPSSYIQTEVLCGKGKAYLAKLK